MTDEGLVRTNLDELLRAADRTDSEAFLGHQFDLGLARVHFPQGRGGLGVSPKLQPLVQQAIADADAPILPWNVGPGMAAPTIVTHGTPDQQDRFLRPLFSGAEVWCQLFSEPGAGSDLAALATSARRDGDVWTVNGQKVWTSVAHLSNWGLLLARTDPDQPKHKGLTVFVLDMHGPGVEVRPLRQMSGHAEFNEVFITDAAVPDDRRIGPVGEGWRVALTTLMNERFAIGGAQPRQGEGLIEDAIKAWEQGGRRDGVWQDRLVRLWVRAEVQRLTNIRAAQRRSLGVPGPEGSISKLAFAELAKDIADFTMDSRGPAALLCTPYEAVGRDTDDPTIAFVRAQSRSIGGGTSEVMRNIIGERALGLPGDLRVDKDRPWSEVLRS
ncbi:MAG: acyl-CoA dehydrogenase family protein [Acidimicrobiales bacterium]|nr:acyl-CoA dehydrogenase family protein [Acidimicrobiales bacterium]